MVVRRDGVEIATWTLDAGDRPGLEVIDELAHLALRARRIGCTIEVRHPCVRLAGLLAFSGLTEVIPTDVRHPVDGSDRSDRSDEP